jgi:hypothetical protein
MIRRITGSILNGSGAKMKIEKCFDYIYPGIIARASQAELFIFNYA